MCASALAPLRLVAVAACLCAIPPASRGATIVEPPVLKSRNGVLSILMVARPDRLPLEPFDVTGWVYDICPRPANGGLSCPSSFPNLYGGVRLQLEKGDALEIRLVNKLPLALNSKHQAEKGYEYLRLNPTNLHTHGMLVSTHFPTMRDKTYGDNVFVLTLNPANGRPGPGQHIHGDVRYTYTDYRIEIPRNHPSGLFWFHPHPHGLSLNQISAGMAGIITIGSLSDYVCTTACGVPDALPVRHLILKDTQVLNTGALFDQQEPTFCDPQPAANDPPRRGDCLQANTSGANRARWYFVVNGQQYPNIPVAAPAGEIWRITNASASVTYNLALHDLDARRDLLMQVLAIDGVSVKADSTTPADVLRQVLGPGVAAETCPHAESLRGVTPLCTRRLIMFPSSRVELWVTYRNGQGLPAAPHANRHAVFRTLGINTGPGGDDWPTVDLASVTFRPGFSGAPAALTVSGEAEKLADPVGLAAEMAKERSAFATAPDCKPLAAGHFRRIFFNAAIHPLGARTSGAIPAAEFDPPFGLGYEEVDENGHPVPGTFVDVSVFDPAKPTICLTLGPGNAPAYERWQLINLASEDHNFHMHQSKFALLTRDETEGTETPRNLLGHGVLHDNVPLQHADGDCGTVDDWRRGKCRAHPVSVEIPFTVPGDYVYHCHILEHEDGGMMARIRVRGSP